MPSPFPGMDPWIEDPELFPDFHDSFCMGVRESLNKNLPSGYFARTNTIVWTEHNQRREPDVSVLTHEPRFPAITATATLPGLRAVGALEEAVEQMMIEVYTIKGTRLVTAFEVLSLANKLEGPGRLAYQKKQQELILAHVNLVEFDFLRDGRHTTLLPLHRLQSRKRSKFLYHVSVLDARYVEQQLFATTLSLSDRLPEIGIPIEADQPPILLDLQAILDQAYDSGRYAQQIDYTRTPTPPLSAEQQAWADELLRAKGVT